MEQWKWIKYRGYDFTGKYMVSDHGRVKSVGFHSSSGQYFAPRIKALRKNKKRRASTSYLAVSLYYDGKQVDVEVHRLVAAMFLPPVEGKTYVNHKDGDGTNNHADNLEWCTQKENAAHSVHVLGHNPKKWKAKPIAQKTTDGELIKVWESAWEIQRSLGFCQVSISRCCRRQKKSGIQYGYLWDFAENDERASNKFSEKQAI